MDNLQVTPRLAIAPLAVPLTPAESDDGVTKCLDSDQNVSPMPVEKNAGTDTAQPIEPGNGETQMTDVE
jgi:hypothetical protein